MDREGEVIYAEIVGNEAIVGIATIADAEVGDKLAGDHGNKGVMVELFQQRTCHLWKMAPRFK